MPSSRSASVLCVRLKSGVPKIGRHGTRCPKRLRIYKWSAAIRCSQQWLAWLQYYKPSTGLIWRWKLPITLVKLIENLMHPFHDDTLVIIDIQAPIQLEILTCINESFSYMPGWQFCSSVSCSPTSARFFCFNLSHRTFEWWRTNDTFSDTMDEDEIIIKDTADISRLLEFIYLNDEKLRDPTSDTGSIWNLPQTPYASEPVWYAPAGTKKPRPTKNKPNMANMLQKLKDIASTTQITVLKSPYNYPVNTKFDADYVPLVQTDEIPGHPAAMMYMDYVHGTIPKPSYSSHTMAKVMKSKGVHPKSDDVKGKKLKATWTPENDQYLKGCGILSDADVSNMAKEIQEEIDKDILEEMLMSIKPESTMAWGNTGEDKSHSTPWWKSEYQQTPYITK